MKKFLLLLIFILIVFSLIFSNNIEFDMKQEGVMHYNMALNAYNGKNYSEAARILEEIVSYYDTEDLKSYELLIKIYKKLDNKERIKELEEIKKSIKKAKTLREKNKKLSDEDILKIGTPLQKLNVLKTLSFKEEKYIPQLIHLLKDPFFNHYLGIYEIRQKVSDILVGYGSIVEPYLIRNLDSKDDNLRWWSLETLSKIYKNTPSKEKVEIFLSKLKDQNPNVKIVVMKTLARWNQYELIKPYIKEILQKEKNEKVIYETLSIISEGKIYEVKESLLNFLSSKSKILVNQAIKTIAILSKERQDFSMQTKEILLDIAKNSQNPSSTRYYAVKALGEILREEKKDKLKELIYSEDYWVRVAVVSVLGDELTYDSEESHRIKIEVLGDFAKKLSLENEDVFYDEARFAAIFKSLRYLEKIQKEDGSLPSYFPLGTTQLATLCFLKQGYSREYPFVKKALDFILKWQQEDGSFYCALDEGGKKKPVYQTALSLIVLVELKDSRYNQIIKSSMEWLKEIQTPEGGFGYYKGSRPDITCTKFAILALDKAYEYWGLSKNDETFMKAIEYLKEMQNPDGGFGYTKDFKKHSYGSATTDGIIALILSKADKKLVERGLKWISENYTWDTVPYDPDAKRHYEYYHWSKSQALHLAGVEKIKDKEGKEHNWYEEVTKKMLREQDTEGFWINKDEPLFTTYFISVLQLKNLKNFLSEL